MPELDNFSPEEQFQDINKKVANKIIREYFKDISALEGDLDLTTSRQALLKACLHKENDPLLLTIGRNQLFYNYTTYSRELNPQVSADLYNEISEEVATRPRIVLFFREDEEDVEPGYQALPMEMGWRIMDETHKSINKSQLIAIGNKIKTHFGSGNGYVFKKGRKVVTYTNKSQGYQFSTRARTLQDGKALIREVLSMNGHAYDAKRLKLSEVEDEAEAFPYNPGTEVILGKTTAKPRYRPMTSVRFRYSYATLSNPKKPIYLYSRSDFLPDALVR